MAEATKKSNEVEEFMNGSLILWLESCLPRPEILTGYQALLDGTIINSVCLQINPEPQHLLSQIGKNLEGPALAQARSKNFVAIVQNLKALYEEELGQTLLVLPDCSVLGANAESRNGVEQMKLLLTLLLGAAVQCPSKELFVARLKEQLDTQSQFSIVALIKQVTESQTIVLTEEFAEKMSQDSMCAHIVRLAKERDRYHSNWILASAAVAAEDSTLVKNTSSPPSNAGNERTSESHLNVELADLKSKMRKMRQELEEKSEAYIEVKEELDHKLVQYEKLRAEGQEWYSEARKAAAYRDEADVLREKADRVERLEMELQKLREKLSDSEFYKARVEELREDNKNLMETKFMLEEELQGYRKKSEHILTLEGEIMRYRQKINDLSLELDSSRSKIDELLEENAQLQMTAKNLVSSADLSMSDEDAPNSGDNSLSEQLTSNAQSRVLKLELENRRLIAQIESYRESSFHESSDKILRLERDKKELSLKLERLQENIQKHSLQYTELEDLFKNALEENKKVQDALGVKQQTIDKYLHDQDVHKSKIGDLESQIEMLSKEKQRIINLNESTQRRADDLTRSLEIKSKESDEFAMRCKDMDSFKDRLYDAETKLTASEKENSTLTKEVSKLKESAEEKDKQLDENISKIESQLKEIQRLDKDLEDIKDLETRIQDMEKENQDLSSQHKIDEEMIQNLQNDLVTSTLEVQRVKQNIEKLGLDENMCEDDVNRIVERLVRNPETFKTIREVMLNVNQDTSSVCVLCHKQEIFTVERAIEFEPKQKQKGKVIVNLELKDPYSQLKAEMDMIQSANESLNNENARQKVEVSTLQSQITSLNTQHVALQVANSQLAVEKDSFLKQLETIKEQNVSLHHDQVALQSLHEQLNSEYDALNSEKEILRTSNRDLKNENRDLKEQTVTLDKAIQELKLEMETLQKVNLNLVNLRAEHSKLMGDFRNLYRTHDLFKTEYKNMQEQYRNIRNENSRVKLQNSELSGEVNIQNERIKDLEFELTKATQQVDMLFQLNHSLDSDRKTLMEHVSQLLAQYHELLSHSLEDKQHYHEEEKNFTDKVNHLYRQKEKLEEKIMEHYRKLENCSPKKKTFGSSFVKKVRKAGSDLISRVPNRNRRSWIEDSRLTHSQLNLGGSESGGNESDNSAEDSPIPPPLPSSSTPELPPPINRNSHLRQSLQRKPTTTATTDPGILSRGGIRSSLQSSHRNSFPSFDGPDITGNSLGQAGTRRTVYLIDENTDGNTASPTPQAAEKSGSTKIDSPPSTFLMFNKISNVISTMEAGGSNGHNLDDSKGSQKSGKSDGKKADKTNRENAVWYEYGCV